MSFLKTVPEELTAAAAQLGTIGAAMAAQTLPPRRPPQPSLRRPSMRFRRCRRRSSLRTAPSTSRSAPKLRLCMTCLSTLWGSAPVPTASPSRSTHRLPPRHSRGSQGSVGHHPSDDGVVPARTLRWHWQHPQHRGRELGLRHVYADRPCRRRPPACRGGGRGRLGSRWGSRLGRIGCIGRGRSRPRRGRNCGRPGQRIRDRHVVGAARLGRTGDPGIHHQHTAGRGLDRRRAAGRRGDVHPRDARGGLGRTQQRRLRCTALRRQTHRHAQASNRLGGRRTGGHAQPTTKFSQITPRKRNTPWISELYPLRSTPHACTPARVQDR